MSPFKSEVQAGVEVTTVSKHQNDSGEILCLSASTEGKSSAPSASCSGVSGSSASHEGVVNPPEWGCFYQKGFFIP